MRHVARALAFVALFSHVGSFSCHDDHDDFIEDVTVEISGDAGTSFEAFLEDDRRTQTVRGVVPFSSDFPAREDFFRAFVDKDSSGSESICVEISTPHKSRRSCTDDPFGQVSVTLVF